MTPFVVTRLARQDLEEIWDYLAAVSTSAAERVLGKLEEVVMKLAKKPRLGPLREDLADSRHRFFLVYSYLIVNRPDSQPPEIVRVLHASRGVRALLGLPESE
jgi:toxin ParE1/3/4